MRLLFLIHSAFLFSLAFGITNNSLSTIGGLFGVSKGVISSNKTRMNQKKQPHGRPRVLSHEQIQIIANEIKVLYDQNIPPDIDMLVDMIFDKFSLSIKYDTLYRIIRDSKLMKTFEDPVMESIRAEVPLEVIELHYSILNNVFNANNVPPCFVFNVDESGFMDFIDIKKHTIVHF